MSSVPEQRRRCHLDGCRKYIPKGRKASAKYCSPNHQRKAADRRKYQREREKRDAQKAFENPKPSSRKREGEVYEYLKSHPRIVDLLLDGSLTSSAVASQQNWTVGAVTRGLHAVKVEMNLAEMRDGWEQSWRVRAMLPLADMNALKELDPESREFEETLDHVVRAYAAFSRWFFELEGKRPLIKRFHIRWIKRVIKAWATGGKQLILSPPRHGKSEMLVRFVVWFICMDPNIRIGWFCASRDVASLMLGAVRDHLENNKRLIEDVLPPGEVFRPDSKSGFPWTQSELKVAQCTRIGQKSSSLLALGRTSKFLSRDMDLIVIDDMEDFDSTREPSQRTYSRNKLAEIGTRKEEHTAEVYIGSRQHPDDIPQHIMALDGSALQWDVVVDTAHAEDCPLDPDDWNVHVDCMLFPEVRSYRWLMEKKLEMETLGIPGAYDMRYLNRPIPAESQVFDVNTIREVALNRDRGIGLGGLPLGHLVGGLDPSARGVQASFIWHYREPTQQEAEAGLKLKMSMVDLDATQAGGQAGAVRIIRDWYHEYGLSYWLYETNSQQIDFYDRIRKDVAASACHVCGEGHPDIAIKDHNTGQNKKDAELGISAMAPLYHNGTVDLPYGTNDARVKVNMLLRQLELWTTDGVQNKGAKTDIKMAQWFPWAGRIQKWMKRNNEVHLELEGQQSYPAIESFTGTSPWASSYPGGF